MQGTPKAEKAESIAWVTSMVLLLTSVIGMYANTGQIQGYFQLVGFAGSIFLCWATFHYRYRVNKEKKAHNNTTTLKN